MQITRTYNWNRRDFSYDAKCEHCGHESKGCHGYDDRNYYNNVLPTAICHGCGESSNSKTAPNPNGLPQTTITPKYPEGLVI